MENDDEEEEISDGERDLGNSPEIGEMVEISLNSVVGLTTPQTMKLRGKVYGQEVVVLVDCGPTHNFISTKLVEKLILAVVTTKGNGVVMGTGISVQGKGVCKGVVFSLPELEVVEDFLPLDVGSSDVILRMQWLGTLGGMHVNWQNLTMKFKLGESWVTLQGELGLSRSLVSLKSMMKVLKKERKGMLVELCEAQVEANRGVGEEQVPAVINDVLHRFEQVLLFPIAYLLLEVMTMLLSLKRECHPLV